MEIGKRLRETRERKGLSQQEVAEKLHVTRQSISRWETDKSCPDLENLVILGKLYQTSIDNLLEVEKEEGFSEHVEEKISVEDEKCVKQRERDWKEQGILFAIALVSCLFPPLGVIVPVVMLWKYRKEKIGLLLKLLCVICVLVSVYNCFITLNSWCGFFVQTDVTVID